MFDRAANGERPGEQLRGAGRIGGAEQAANPARRNRAAAISHRRHDFGGEAVLRAQCGKLRGIAAAVAAKGEITPRHHAGNAHAPH